MKPGNQHGRFFVVKCFFDDPADSCPWKLDTCLYHVALDSWCWSWAWSSSSPSSSSSSFIIFHLLQYSIFLAFCLHPSSWIFTFIILSTSSTLTAAVQCLPSECLAFIAIPHSIAVDQSQFACKCCTMVLLNLTLIPTHIEWLCGSWLVDLYMPLYTSAPSIMRNLCISDAPSIASCTWMDVGWVIGWGIQKNVFLSALRLIPHPMQWPNHSNQRCTFVLELMRLWVDETGVPSPGW